MTIDRVDDSEMLEGAAPTKEDLFYLEWGKSTLKENLAILNGMFRLFVTLDTTLLSAYLGFYDKVFGAEFSLSWQATLPPVFVIVSLIASIVGIYPFGQRVNISAPQEIRKYKEKRARFKSRCLAVAAIMLILGFIVLLVARLAPVPVSSFPSSSLSTPVP
jgi:hypothetical protein